MTNSFVLKICPINEMARDFYSNHTTYHESDAGLDLFCLEDQTIKGGMMGESICFGIKCEMAALKQMSYHDTLSGPRWGKICSKSLSYMLVPKSSISNTSLRMSNSIEIIDSDYRGEIIATVDNIVDRDYIIHKGDRLFQLVHPSLKSFRLDFDPKDGLSDTSRGEGGFGSTNQN